MSRRTKCHAGQYFTPDNMSRRKTCQGGKNMSRSSETITCHFMRVSGDRYIICMYVHYILIRCEKGDKEAQLLTEIHANLE